MSQLTAAATALLERIRLGGGEITFFVMADGAETFRLLHELKQAGLIEEVASGTLLGYRYRMVNPRDIEEASK